MNRREAIRVHAKRRAAERYGLCFGDIGEAKIVAAIQNPKESGAVFRWRTSNRVTVFDVPFRGQIVRVAYDKDRKAIVTFLPLPPEKGPL